MKAVGSGGRTGRTDKGDCSSHFNCVFTYPSDVHVSFASTQFGKAAWGVGMQYYGTKGCAEARYDAPVRISGETNWEFPGLEQARGHRPGARRHRAVQGRPRRRRRQQAEGVHRRASSSGNLLNEANQGAESALAAMLGRMAASTGEEVTWDELLKSKEVWDPKMDWKQFA